MTEKEKKTGIWCVYDGDCPLCRSAANNLRIDPDLSPLHLVNAREDRDHRLIKAITERGLDLDEGLVVYDGKKLYHGRRAITFLARHGEAKGSINFFNKVFLRRDLPAQIIYPLLRGVRNFLLKKNNVPRIDNLQLKTQPVFKRVFGGSWKTLPLVLQKRYGCRPYSQDIVTVTGKLTIQCRRPIRALAPLFKLISGLPTRNEDDISTTVHFSGDVHKPQFHCNRTLYFKNQKRHLFRSRMLALDGNEVVELMRGGFGWRLALTSKGGRVIQQHKGFVFSLAGLLIPLPLTAILGSVYAEETAIDNFSYDMVAGLRHPRWGTLYEYRGRFIVKRT